MSKKKSIEDYLNDANNGWVNRVCYEVMSAYFRDHGLEGMCEQQIQTIFEDVHSCISAIKHQRYTADWGNRKEDGAYVLPDGTDFSKFTKAHYLPLYMPMLWWKMFLTEGVSDVGYEKEKIRLELLERIREKFNNEDTEKPIFRRFDTALGATVEQVEEAICQIAPTLQKKVEWRGVIDELDLIVSYCEKIDHENPHRGGCHKTQRLKYMSTDIERLTEARSLYDSVKKPESGSYPHVQYLFRNILASIKERNRQHDE